MKHIPYGYKIVDGKAVIDEEQATAVRTLFDGYISGLGLMASAKEAGLNIYHGSVGRMLRNRHYLGDDYYPPIIDKEIFNKAEEIRIEKAERLGRIREIAEIPKPTIVTEFIMPKVKKKYVDPFLQAEYVYSQIGSVVKVDE